MAVTRIKNNQITDSTITYQKIASGTLVGSLFNPNLTFNSNINVVGNLSVSGNTTTVNSIDTLVNDPLITLNNGYVGTPSYDVGILINRALGSLGNYGGVNAALAWSESDGAFITVLTTDTGTTAGTINRTFKANLIVGNLTVANALTAQSATITTLNATTFNATNFVASGNIVAASGTASGSVTSGAIVVPDGGGVGITGALHVGGTSDFIGNITAGNIYLTGNINVPVGGVISNTAIFYGDPTTGINALFAGVPGFTPVVATVAQFAGNSEIYSEVNFENTWNGPSSTADFVLTTDDGTDSAGYGDFGITSSSYNGTLLNSYSNGPGTVAGPRDVYLYAHGNQDNLSQAGGNLLIGTATSGKIIKVFAGGMNIADVITTTTSSGFQVNATTAASSSTSGALRVSGGAGIAGDLYIGGSLNAASATFASINNTPIGNTTPSTGAFTDLSGTTLVATNFSTGNARITGGYADNLPIGANVASTGRFTTVTATTVDAGTTTTATLNSTNGNITTLTSTTVNAGTTTTATLNTTAANITSGAATTLVATNFSSGNARITGGYADNFPIGANVASTGKFTTVTATTVDAGTTTTATLNSTNGNITTLTSTTVNAGTTTTATLNSTNGNVTTLAATNFSTGNARITGGYADNFPIGANVASTGRFTTVTATTVDAGTTTTATLNSTSGNITTLTSTTVNAGTTTTATLNSTNGNVTTLVATNFSSANARIIGGYADNFPIGANTKATGAFTTLTADNNVTFTGTTESTNASSGILIVSGGVGVAKNLNVGGNVVITGNLTVNGDVTTVNTATLDVEDLNITVAKGAASAAAANGGGLTVDGANATFTYASTDDSWNVNKKFNAPIIAAATADITSGNVTTLVAPNFSSGNARITGGYADNFPIGANTAAPGTFTTATATTVNAGTTTTATLNSTNGNITTLTSTTVNAGTATAATLNSTNGNITTLTSTTVNAGITTTATLNSTNGNVTTLYAQNFSTGNARITGGYADNFPIGANTAAPGTFTTATATTINAGTTTTATLNSTNGNITTLAATNFSSGNARITGGYADNFPIGANTAAPGTFTTATATTVNAGTTTTATLNSTNGNITTLAATNFSSGNARITGGYADNFPIGANTAAPGTFTTVTAATVNASTTTTAALNSTNGNITTLTSTTVNAGTTTTATLNSTNGNITTLNAGTTTTATLNTTSANITGGSATTLVVSNFSTGNARITGGYADNFPIGANTAAPGTFTTLTAATESVGGLQAQAIGNVTPGTGSFTTLTVSSGFSSSGNLVAGSGTSSTNTTTGALVVVGGAGVSGNINVGQGAIINSNKSTYDTIVRGVNENSLVYVYADSVYDQVSIGGNLTAANVTQGAKLHINSKDSVLIPVGTSADRPSSQGYTDVDGMLRYNTTINSLEYYGNGQWNAPSISFTVITARTYQSQSGDPYGNVDGVNLVFTLPASSTTNGTVVSLNGVLQIPSIAYTVSGTTLTFTEAPSIGDVIDARVVTTTSTVDKISGPSGFNHMDITNDYISFYSGNLLLGSVENWRIDTGGDFYPTTTSNIGYPTATVDYIYANTVSTVKGSIVDDTRGQYVAPSATDALYSFPVAQYRSGKFMVQLSSGSNYHVVELLAVHDGSTCNVVSYGSTIVGSALATFAGNVSGGIAYVNATSLGSNLVVKVSATLMKI